MPIAKVLARGQITLPKSIRKALHVKPGDRIAILPTGPNRAEIEVLPPPMTLEETFERWHIEGPFDWHKMREEMEEEMAKDFLERMLANDEPRPS